MALTTIDSDAIASLLRRASLRATPQRIAVMAAVSRLAEHSAFDDIARTASELSPGMNVSTVYRTLETLERHHLVRRSDLGWRGVVYHPAEQSHHHHLVCHCCGTTIDCEDAILAPLFAALADQYGFAADVTHQILFGHCAACQTEHPPHG